MHCDLNSDIATRRQRLSHVGLNDDGRVGSQCTEDFPVLLCKIGSICNFGWNFHAEFINVANYQLVKDLLKNGTGLRRRRGRRRRDRERRQHARRRGVVHRRGRDIVRRRQPFRRRDGVDTRRREDLGHRRHGEDVPRRGRVLAVGDVRRHHSDVEGRRREVLNGERNRRQEALAVTALRRRGVCRRRGDNQRDLEGFIQRRNPLPHSSCFQRLHNSLLDSRRCRRHRRSSSSRHHRHESRQRSQHSHHRHSSSSTRDYSPTLSDSPFPRVSPIDDVNTFQEVLVRGATKLNIPLAVPAPSTSVIFETLHHRTSSRPLLPLVPGLIEPAMDIFLTPAATKSAPSRLIKKYRPPEQDPLFLRSDPVPDSVVIVAAKKLHSTSPSSSSPPDKRAERLMLQDEKYALLQPSR
ncbi:hypothetical protein NDU88_001222 [Pleurodeles waltl]|uniref:Uncharacterized protein n=1 Tax=Pleurodeles waltl TaxID=8319 RepID=A0AAV7LX16_PLEWA|nr:hypothetical protein NDU88_001222 [Pleurodeles waltl]